MSMIQLTVNGSVKQYDGDPAMPVLWYLRDLLELTGAKFGCGMGLCGACTVHVEGKATRSCVTNLSDVAGKRITTIEGLDPKGDHPLQKAWRAVNVPQCGYCQSGQIMQAASLLTENPSRRIAISMMPCKAISAVAERISASGRP
jgi:isoquinoline 1-oxidoreductase alpha subunit